MSTRPEWIEPGAEVVVIHGRHQQPSPVLKIDRVGKRDIVLTSGDRFSLGRLSPNGEHVTKRGEGAWSPSSALFPAGHPRVARARREQDEREGVALLRSLAYKVDVAVRAGRWDDALKAARPMVVMLADRVEDGGQ